MLADRLQSPDLIARFYEAAAAPGNWDAALDALCAAFEAEAGVLFHQPGADEKPLLLAANPKMARLRPAEDPLLPVADGGEYHRLRASVALDGGARAGMGLNRLGGEEFSDTERAALDRVAQHLAAALRLEQRLAAERLHSAARGAALDQWRHGVVITTGSGDVVFANMAAESLTEGGGLTLERDRIGCSERPEAETLLGLIQNAARRGRSGATRISRRLGRSMLAANVSPLPVTLAGAAPTRGLVMVIIRDLLASSEASPAELMGLFGLTPAEAALLPQLLSGESAAVVAASRGVAVPTVRAQVARILDKTGAANLRALATMMSGW